MNISASYQPVTLSEALNRTLEKRSREFQENQSQSAPQDTYQSSDEQSFREQFAFDADYGRFFGPSSRQPATKVESQKEKPATQEQDSRQQFQHDPDYGRFFGAA